MAENLLFGQITPAPAWALVLSSHLARYLFAARGRLAARQMPTKLVLKALEQALTLRQPAPGLITHADCDS